VISLSGDGGFTMLMGDFLILAQLNLPVKVVVFNNSALGFIEIEQKSTGFLDFKLLGLRPGELQLSWRGTRFCRKTNPYSSCRLPILRGSRALFLCPERV
jgi:hypothetical protein